MPCSRAWIAIGVLLLCSLGSGGCSYLFVDGPPKQHKQMPYFTCSTSKGWPVVDTVIGGVYGIAAISAFAAGAGAGSNDTTVSGAAAAGVAALMLASAVSGYHDVSECREATQELQMRLMRMQPGPAWYPGPSPDPAAPAPAYDPWVRPMNQPFGSPPAPAPAPANPAPGP